MDLTRNNVTNLIALTTLLEGVADSDYNHGTYGKLDGDDPACAVGHAMRHPEIFTPECVDVTGWLDKYEAFGRNTYSRVFATYAFQNEGCEAVDVTREMVLKRLKDIVTEAFMDEMSE